MAGESMIVKLQVPLATNETAPLVLAYNEDRTVVEQFPLTRPILDMMDDGAGRTRAKAYFEAYIDDDGRLVLGADVGEQDW